MKSPHFRKNTKKFFFFCHVYKSSKPTSRLADFHWVCWPPKGSKKPLLEALLRRGSVSYTVKCTRRGRGAGTLPDKVFALMSLPLCHDWLLINTPKMRYLKDQAPLVRQNFNSFSILTSQCWWLVFQNSTKGVWFIVKTKSIKQNSLFFLIPQNIRHKKKKSLPCSWNYRTSWSCNSNTSWKFKNEIAYR